MDNDSLLMENILEFHDRIKASQYQNKINVQRLHALECADEKTRKETSEREKIVKKCHLENKEWKKELKTKKKFLFNM